MRDVENRDRGADVGSPVSLPQLIDALGEATIRRFSILLASLLLLAASCLPHGNRLAICRTILAGSSLRHVLLDLAQRMLSMLMVAVGATLACRAVKRSITSGKACDWSDWCVVATWRVAFLGF
ncbi:hypothetical protein [Xanthomonas sp. GPE 39]|uniref:hypothetical protein n=1 Tax=Xanthomonas sp. GPE 39 TaxID=1583099 RepID=UPI00126A249E|nr:hypothetical protein [Xanthomonas sp. GPE 39]